MTLKELARQYVIADANIRLAYGDNTLTRRGRRDVDTYNATMEQMKKIATREEIDTAIIQAKKELAEEYDATITNIETVHNSIVEDMREKLQ
jgi:histidinol dehydrogenase